MTTIIKLARNMNHGYTLFLIDLIIFFIQLTRFGSGVCFFTFSQYMGHVGSNLFVTVAIGGLIVIPGVILCIPIVQHFGRKLTIMLFELMTAACFLSILAFPKGSYPGDWPRVLFAGLGILFISIFLPVLHLYTGELFPTVARNAGFGVMSMFSRLGSMLAPFIVGLEGYYSSLPLITLCVLMILLTILLYPLPETKGCPLPDTIEDAEHFERYLHIGKSDNDCRKN